MSFNKVLDFNNNDYEKAIDLFDNIELFKPQCL